MTVGWLATLFSPFASVSIAKLAAFAGGCAGQVGSPCVAFAPPLADRVHFQHGQPASASVRKAHGKEKTL
jgi:hypothetical protein